MVVPVVNYPESVEHGLHSCNNNEFIVGQVV